MSGLLYKHRLNWFIDFDRKKLNLAVKGEDNPSFIMIAYARDPKPNLKFLTFLEKGSKTQDLQH